MRDAMRQPLLARSFWSLMIVGVLSVVMWTCKYPSGPLNPNTIPDTQLSNIPANDTIARYINRNAFPELSLSWIGNDPDGYITAFQYRWTSTRAGQPFPSPGNWTTLLNITKTGWGNIILVKGNPSSIFNIYNYLVTLGQNDTSLIRIIGDSLATNRTFAVPYKTGIVPTDSIVGETRLVLQTPSTGTFIFGSPADSNFHRFDIRAVDNSDDIDPSPASVYFWTLVSPGSIVRIDGVPAANALIIDGFTDTFDGLRFAFSSLDANNTESIDYSWSVDDTVTWSPWSRSQEAFVTAIDLNPRQSGAHRFYVRARNRWGVVSPDSSRVFTVTVPKINDPTWPHRTLIINNDINGNGTRGRPTLAQVDSLYREIMDSLGRTGRFDIWRVAQSVPAVNQWPSRDSLGYYTSVVILMEQLIPPIGAGSAQRMSVTTQGFLREYLNIGGKLIYSGSPSIVTAITNYNTFGQFGGTWATDVFHITPNTQQSPFIVSPRFFIPDFNGAFGTLGYPNVSLDTSKIATDSTFAYRAIGDIGINFPIGFAQTISFYDSRTNGILENLPLGIRFQGVLIPPATRRTYSVIYFGFPLYYARKTDMIQSLRKAFEDIYE